MKVEIPGPALANSNGKDEYWLILQSASGSLPKENLTRQLKLAASLSMNSILTHALPGLPLTLENTPPLGVSYKPGEAYLRIDHTSHLWLEVGQAHGLSLSWREAPADVEALFVVTDQ
jgi:type VI secretion system protein ImpJ